MSEQKKIYRKEALRHRSFIDPGSEDLEAVVEQFFNSVNPSENQVIAAYCAKDKEFDPYPILEALLKKGYQCALPVIQKESQILRFALWAQDEELTEGPFEILQPLTGPKTRWVDPDIVVVPLLAFDRKGRRLGYGGGYYDATLHALRQKKEIMAVGVAYAQQAVLFHLPVEDHDEHLDWVITPQDAHDFRGL